MYTMWTDVGVSTVAVDMDIDVAAIESGKMWRSKRKAKMMKWEIFMGDFVLAFRDLELYHSSFYHNRTRMYAGGVTFIDVMNNELSRS